ncbi:MAG: phospholipase D-like domain-containing protein, partial [Bhargavaea sp.]
KTGLPNMPVAEELIEDSEGRIEIRFYNAVIGQYHTKLVYVKDGDTAYISNGAANMTERALDDYNLEADLRIEAPSDSPLADELDGYFNRLWNNEDALYTLEAGEKLDGFSQAQRVVYGLQKLLKLTTY